MLEPYRVAFLGDSHIDDTNATEEQLEVHIRRLIDENWYVEILVGCNGDFDKCVISTLEKIRKQCKNYNSSLVIYSPKFNLENIENIFDFDKINTDICYYSFEENVDMKLATKICNCKMIDKADLVICSVNQENTMVAQTVQYAVLLEKPITYLT